MIKALMDREKELQIHLFTRGFLITDREFADMDGYPFYGNWNCKRVEGYFFLTHCLVNLYSVREGDKTFFLIGHAYNPFTMEADEEKVLLRIAQAYTQGEAAYYDAVDEITGIFLFGYVDQEQIHFIIDPSGMQSGCYGKIDGKFYVSSHPQLVGDLCGLTMDSLVKELVSYKWYGRVMGPYLPGDLTPFSELKRIVPNIDFCYKDGVVQHTRFYPRKEIAQCANSREYDAVIKKAADILKNNMELIARKWERPQISLTGGIDSNTTFAAANGNYDKYETFSYLSAEKEIPDVEAAEKIAKRFGVKHTLYRVPQTDEGIEKYDQIVRVLRHNNGYIADGKPNELRKRCVLQRECTAGVEVKSWASETIRGYWYKHYGRKSMPKLSPKLFRNLYKIFILNRSLAHKVDRIFAQYIRDFAYENIPAAYPPADMHYWEVTWGSWGGVNISEMKFCFDITMAYNNRVFLDTLFRVPLEKRISDQHHLDMKKYLNPELYDMHIRVVNMKETDFRAFMLNIIFTLNSVLPF